MTRFNPPPNLQLRAGQRPHWRAVILAVSPTTYFNDNSALALRDVMGQLRGHHRELILSGITAIQYKMLVRNGVFDVSDPENLCPDIEFAIARGIAVLRHPTSGMTR